MSDRVLILHGWGGSDAPHWQAELASAVAMGYGTVSFPLLDNPHFPSKNRWVRQVKSILDEFKPDTVVCHSVACTLWFWLCGEDIAQVERLYLVSPPSLATDIDTIKSFFPISVPRDLRASNAQMIVSDDDPYISIIEATEMAEIADTPLIVIESAGHINADSGYGKWELIESMVLLPHRSGDDTEH